MSQLKNRLIVAAWGIPLLLILVVIGHWVFALAVAVVAVVSQWEFYKMKDLGGFPVWIALATGWLLPLTAHFYSFKGLFLVMLAGFIVIALYLPALKIKDIQARFGIVITGVIYPSLFLAFLAMIRDADYGFKFGGAWVILFIVTTIWVCDTSAYFGGVKFGRHKLAPVVSPNKTWEGAAFGFFGTLLWAVIVSQILQPLLAVTECIVIAVIIGVAGQLGDLAESSFKRSARVKDTGSVFGAHGGMFDRFDSLIAATPLIFIFFVLTGKI